MKLLFTATTLSLAIAAGNACAATEPAEKDAIALVEKGVALVKSDGKAEMIKRINAKDPVFVQSAMYIYMSDARTGVILAHPMNPALVGKDLIDVPDTNGKPFRRAGVEMVAKQGKGWIDYTYKNPASGKIEPKTTYLMKVDDVILQAGIYKK